MFQVSSLKSSRVAVLGLARTGLSVARFLLDRGARVLALDEKTGGTMDESAESIRRAGAEVRLGPVVPKDLESADLVVLSPGVSVFHPAVRAVADRVPVWSEIELASRFLTVPIVAVTGTNGKSTTTVLLGNMFEAAGSRVFVGGNLGVPLIEAVGGNWDRIVCEVSSFQLEAVHRFRPSVGVCLNVSDNHLDRHKDMREYESLKRKLFANQTADDWAVLNVEDERIIRWIPTLPACVCGFGRRPGSSAQFHADGDRIVGRIGPGEESYSLEGSRLTGMQNLENAAAAVAAARLAGCTPEAVRGGLAAFQPLPHRMAWVREVQGVGFWDDSKATNVGAVLGALESVEGTAVLILGGLDKGGDFGLLAKKNPGKLRAVVLLGQARDRIHASLKDAVPARLVGSMAEAVQAAWEAAKPGDQVLLSPGCASFDMFKNYEERGECFGEAVRRLAGSMGRGRMGRASGGRRTKGEYEARMC